MVETRHGTSLQFHGGVLGDASIDFVEMLCINSLRVAES